MCICVSILLHVIKVYNEFCCIQLDSSMVEHFHYVDLQVSIIKLNCSRQSFILFITIGNIKNAWKIFNWVLLTCILVA